MGRDSLQDLSCSGVFGVDAADIQRGAIFARKHANYMHVIGHLGRRTCFRKALATLFAIGSGFCLFSPAALAETHHFSMTIEDTIITLVGKQTFHTFSYNSQTPGPIIPVAEGDDVEFEFDNNTTLPHTIHWHGLYQKGTWKTTAFRTPRRRRSRPARPLPITSKPSLRERCGTTAMST
jgi:hypothetical protein